MARVLPGVFGQGAMELTVKVPMTTVSELMARVPMVTVCTDIVIMLLAVLFSATNFGLRAGTGSAAGRCI